MIKNNFKKIINLFSAIAIFSVVGVASAANPALTTVSVSPSSASMTVGSTTQLSASPLDQNGAAYAATTTTSWSSGNVSVATVDISGLVTGVSAGTSTITASMNDGASTVSGASDITVTAPAPPVPVLTSMAITPASSSISVSSTTQLTASLLDQNGAAYTATTTTSWSSGNASVATVDTNGLVIGVSAGTSTIMATAVSGAGTVTSTADIAVTANATSSAPAASSTVRLGIRDGSTLIGPFTFTLPDANAAPVTVTQASTSTVPARSALAVLTALDTAHAEFDVTDIQYFSSYNSFLVNCISIPSKSSNPDCYDWTYSVDGIFPNVGMDQYTLDTLIDNDIVYVFFGKAWQISTDKTAVTAGESFTATAKKYDASSGTYVAASSTIIGAVQLDASGNAVYDSNWNPVEVATSTADSNGQTQLSLGTAGAYGVGIKESGYYPTVSVAVSAPQPVVPDGAPVGGGSVTVAHHSVDVNSASQFLLSSEAADGSFGNILYTDWAAIALASNGNSTDKIAAYLKSANSGMYVATDYERHAMALMALGINPYTGTPVNYIQKIVDTFDGTQIGDPSNVNDDIFSLFPLSKAGYNGSDQIIQKVTAFILGKQSGDGSWDGNVDMTAAGIQALSLNSGISGVSQAIAGARSYLSAHQSQDGGFGTSFSTSWALQAISALHESQSNWMQNNKTPNDYLYTLQASDGGIEPDSTNLNSRIWATSYAIPAALNKSWGDILLSFPKPSSQPAETASGGGSAATASLTGANNQGASSTTALVAATSSLSMSSSTVASTTASTTPALVNEPSTQNTSTASAVDLLQDNHPKALAGSAVSRGEARVSAAASKDKQASNAGKRASQPPKPAESGLAGIAVFSHNLLSFAANVGGLIVSKFFSIIGINQ